MATMTYLPDNPTLRPAEVYRPRPFFRAPGGAPPAPPPEPRWSPPALWYTVLFMGSTALVLLAWGFYSSMPGTGKAENSLRAERGLSKLMKEARTVEPPLLAEPTWRREPVSIPMPELPPSVESIKVAVLEPPLPALPSDPAPLPLPPPPTVTESPVQPMVKPAAAPKPAPETIELPRLPVEPPSVSLPSVPLPAPAKIEPPVIAPPPPVSLPMPPVAPIVVERSDPQVYLARANLGETPMIRNWKTLALYSLIALAPTPAIAGGQDEKKGEDRDKLIIELTKSSDALKKAMDGYKQDMIKIQEDLASLKSTKLALDIDLNKNTTKITDLEKQLGNIQADVNFLKRQLAKQPNETADKAALDEIRLKLAAIEQVLAKQRTAEPTQSRVALSPPAATARVVLTNMHYDTVLFVINQRTHRVAPGTAMTVESVPAGQLTYEAISPVFGVVQPPTVRTVVANETFTLTAR